jgi:hypothetical protein
MISFRAGRTAAAFLLLVPALAAAQTTERFELTGDRVGIFNLAGDAVVERGSGSAVVVEVTRHGADAAQLRIEQDRIGPGEALRVIYPSDEIVFTGGDWSGQTRIRIAEDGTWGGWARDGSRHRVTIRSRGDGLEAHASLRILVPAGKRVDVYLGIGPIAAADVTADLRLDGGASRVTTERTSGSLVADVGSGEVTVTGHAGNLLIDTGSGSVEVTGMEGDELSIDTGSGGVRLADVATGDLMIDTGSGRVRGSAVAADVVNVDTGSGGVDLAFDRAPERILIDTGSGGVTLTLPDDLDATVVAETSSGGIEVDFEMQVRRWERDEVRGVIGSGRGRVEIDTGSGNITIRKG